MINTAVRDSGTQGEYLCPGPRRPELPSKFSNPEALPGQPPFFLRNVARKRAGGLLWGKVFREGHHRKPVSAHVRYLSPLSLVSFTW